MVIALWIYFVITTLGWVVGTGMRIANGGEAIVEIGTGSMFINFLFFRAPIFIMACLYLLSLSS
jgi:hypothetical protein